MNTANQAACPGGLVLFGYPVRLADSVTEAVQGAAGEVLVTGSHGGLSSGRYALQACAALVVFNDAGIGRDEAGVAALALLQEAGLAACTVGHTSACIGQAASTWQHGVVSRANAPAQALGVRLNTLLRMQQAP